MLQTMKNDGTSIRVDNSVIDQLIVDAILMLRVNLIELAKVADLCNDFRSKYIRKYINQVFIFIANKLTIIIQVSLALFIFLKKSLFTLTHILFR